MSNTDEVVVDNLYSGLNPEIVSEFPYEFDTFQKEACVSLEKGQHVLCLAHTSAGKSTIALYAIAKVLLENKRLIYTAPVKSLSNQKYAELRKKYGDDKVGLATGDNKINLDADILVMTTEILRNMLSKPTWSTNAIKSNIDNESSENIPVTETDNNHENNENLSTDNNDNDERLACVVFDEAHYINDRSRGNVYEECIMKLPNKVQMIFLSATMANPKHFQNWVQKIKPDRLVGVSSTLKRPVPLCFYIFVPKPESFEENMPWDNAINDGHLAVILNGEHSTFLNDIYSNMCKRYHEIVNYKFIKPKEEREKIGINGPPVDIKTSSLPPPPSTDMITLKRVKRTIPWQMSGMLNKFINFLSINNQLPAIFFTLSRKKCNFLANHIESNLITSTERREIENIFNYYIKGLIDYDQYRQVNEIKQLLFKGIGVHHSGMLTILKEIVELIFTKGLIKLMFATETLAIGVNTPTKTTCFTDIYKYDGYQNYKRILTIEEFKQMAGRAGRRGLDIVGNVIYFPIDEPILLNEMNSMLKGPLKVLSSNFNITTQYILRLLRSLPYNTINNLYNITQKSLLSIEMQLLYQEKEINKNNLILNLNELNNNINNILIQTNNLNEIINIEKSLKYDKLSQGNTKKLKQKLSNLFTNLSKKEINDYNKLNDLIKQEIILNENIKNIEIDLNNIPDIGIKIQMEYTIDFLISSNFIFKSTVPITIPTTTTTTAIDNTIDTPTTTISNTLHLTQDGLFASCITQCNEIILTRAIHLGLANEFRHDPILLSAWLSLFIGTESDEQKNKNNTVPTLSEDLPVPLQEACMNTIDIATTLFNEMHLNYTIFSESNNNSTTSEQLYTTFIYPIYTWCTKTQNFEEICLENGFFEGNFVRALQKMVNLFNELLLAFEITNQLEWINCIQTCKETFIHSILLVESIYI